MGCQFPIPFGNKEKEKKGVGQGSVEGKQNFSDYYDKSIASDEGSEHITVVVKKAKKKIKAQVDRSVIVNFEIDKLVRNQFGRVIDSKVSTFIEIK